MRLYRLRDHGSIDNVELQEAPSPVAGPGQVVVRMRAASVNARDLMIVIGPSWYGPHPGLIPLSDGAGEVITIGEGVTGRAVGDRVVASFRQAWLDGPLEPAMLGTDLGGAIDGVLAEEVVFPASGLVAIPDGVTFEAAAALPCAGVTAYRAIMHKTPLPGSVVLVMGTGGVSLFALQIAKAAGCRVIASTSSAEKAALLTTLGADDVINYRETPEWEAEVLRLTADRGADLIVEIGGAGTLSRSFAAASLGATIALVGLLESPFATVSPLPVMGKMLTLQGISVGSRADLASLVKLVSTGGFYPVIDRRFEFREARDALRHLAGRTHFGKIVIGI